MALQKDLVIEQGRTFTQVVRWEVKPIRYVPIIAISKTAPVEVTTDGIHNIPPGWRAAVVSVEGMTQINASADPPAAKDYHAVTVTANDKVQINDINASRFSTYKSGGYLQINTPADLTGATAALSIKDKIGGTELFGLTTENGGIVIDAVNHKITVVIPAANTAAIAWKKGVYDLEVISATGAVTALMAGSVTVTREVTTS